MYASRRDVTTFMVSWYICAKLLLLNTSSAKWRPFCPGEDEWYKLGCWRICVSCCVVLCCVVLGWVGVFCIVSCRVVCRVVIIGFGNSLLRTNAAWLSFAPKHTWCNLHGDHHPWVLCHCISDISECSQNILKFSQAICRVVFPSANTYWVSWLAWVFVSRSMAVAPALPNNGLARVKASVSKMKTTFEFRTHSGLALKRLILVLSPLTHWGRVTHICVSNQTIIGSDNGLSLIRRQAIIWTNAGILLIGHLGTNFNEILIEIHTLSLNEMHLNMSSAMWRPFCLGSMC